LRNFDEIFYLKSGFLVPGLEISIQGLNSKEKGQDFGIDREFFSRRISATLFLDTEEFWIDLIANSSWLHL
jgi:hypothetical protein